MTTKDLGASQRSAMEAELKAAFGRLLRRWKNDVPLTEDEYNLRWDEMVKLIAERTLEGRGNMHYKNEYSFIGQWDAVRAEIRYRYSGEEEDV